MSVGRRVIRAAGTTVRWQSIKSAARLRLRVLDIDRLRRFKLEVQQLQHNYNLFCSLLCYPSYMLAKLLTVEQSSPVQL
jgi:hypothetical protein